MGPVRAKDAAQATTIEDLYGVPDEGLFRAHFENLPGPAYIWQRSGDDFTLLAHNRIAREVAQVPAAERIGTRAKSLQKGRPKLVADLLECADTGSIVRRDVNYGTCDADTLRLAITFIPLTPSIVVQHIEDITDRYAAEQALRESEARTRALIEANPDMLMRVSRDGCYLDVHIPATIADNLPFRVDRFLGRNVSELFEPEFAREHERYRIKALDTGEMQFWQYSRNVEGRTRFVDARFVRSGEDEVFITVTDVTERVELEREVVNSAERERNRIGHDLHDGLGQLLTGVKLILEPVRKRLGVDDSRDSKSVRQAVELINLAIAQTSELARGLSPVSRDGGLTLADALRQLAKRSEDFFGFTCRVTHCDLLHELSEECSNNLYRIAQEAITNAVKHGTATQVELSCVVDGKRLLLTIEDNGVGISAPQASARGIGMDIMHYRARAIGGELTVGCRSEGGTIVSCSCPLVASGPPRECPVIRPPADPRDVKA